MARMVALALAELAALVAAAVAAAVEGVPCGTARAVRRALS